METSKAQNAIIYKICNTINDDVYVGSIVQSLSSRFTQHKRMSQESKTKHYILYQKMNEFGADKFFFALVEDYPCNSQNRIKITRRILY